MKQNMTFSDYPELNDKAIATAASLQKWQHFLLIGLGAVITYAILGTSTPDNLFDTFSSVLLWLLLLLAPAVGGIVILKFPAWQSLALSQRKETILYSFGLSLLTLSTVALFGYRLNPYDVGYILVSSLVPLGYGLFILRLYFRLSQQAEAEEGDLFP